MPTALDVTPEEMAVYRATARRRWKREQQELARRQERAWELARHAARLLKEEFDVSRVVVFGSVGRGAPFHAHSDVDLAVWGLDEGIYYRVISLLLSLEPAIGVDLVRVEDASPALLKAIEEEGVSL